MKELMVENGGTGLGFYQRTSEEKKDLLGSALHYLGGLYSKRFLQARRQSLQVDGFDETIVDHSTVVDEPTSRSITYNDLPDDVQLHILSFIDVITLCRAARVCRRWAQLADDELLWDKKLKRDSHRWEVIDHMSHPKLYQDANSELGSKEIYLRCCPECRATRKLRPGFPLQFPRLTYYLGISVPRIAMFGSGLDSSGLVRRVLWDERSPFTVKGMFPGQFEGVGSGVCLQYDGGSMNLITLHSMPKAERDRQLQAGERRSRFLVSSEYEGELELTQPLKELCTTIDAFIYVIKSQQDDDRVTLGIEEFAAMIDDRWLQPKVPVLVLCCVDNATVSSISALHVANKLRLLRLTRPWQVRQCHVNSLYGFVPGVSWLLKNVMGV